MRIIMLIAIIALGLSACKRGDSPTAMKAPADTVSPPAPRSFWTNWARSDGAYSIDLTDGHFEYTMAYGIYFANGASCTCMISALGNENSWNNTTKDFTAGTYEAASCTYSTGGDGDPGCANLNGQGTFEISGETLTLCDSTSCGTYSPAAGAAYR